MDQFERLAANPHYNLNAQQVEKMESVRKKKYDDRVKHTRTVDKHDTSFKTSNPTLKDENDRK